MPESRLIIDWGTIHFYNTLMAIGAGAALLSMASVFRNLETKTHIYPRGWGLNFGVVGTLVFATGIHTTLTWPLSPSYAPDNIAFGEPCAVLGAICLAMGFYFWSQQEALVAHESPVVEVAKDFGAFRYVLYGAGLGLIGIGLGGIVYGLFTAPPEEPIAGDLNIWLPWSTRWMVGLLWIFTGVLALVTPRLLDELAETGAAGRYGWVRLGLALAGWSLVLIGGLVYFTHIGMVINTMPEGTGPGG